MCFSCLRKKKYTLQFVAFGWSCICVSGVSILPLFLRDFDWILISSDGVVIFVFHPISFRIVIIVQNKNELFISRG